MLGSLRHVALSLFSIISQTFWGSKMAMTIKQWAQWHPSIRAGFKHDELDYIRNSKDENKVWVKPIDGEKFAVVFDPDLPRADGMKFATGEPVHGDWVRLDTIDHLIKASPEQALISNNKFIRDRAAKILKWKRY